MTESAKKSLERFFPIDKRKKKILSFPCTRVFVYSCRRLRLLLTFFELSNYVLFRHTTFWYVRSSYAFSIEFPLRNNNNICVNFTRRLLCPLSLALEVSERRQDHGKKEKPKCEWVCARKKRIRKRKITKLNQNTIK